MLSEDAALQYWPESLVWEYDSCTLSLLVSSKVILIPEPRMIGSNDNT